MNPLLKRVRSLLSPLAPERAAARHVGSDSAASWPAPERKSGKLALKRPTAGSASPLPCVDFTAATSRATPFAPPARPSAFAVPRPVAIEPLSSPWAPPARRVDALVLRRPLLVSVEQEFSRPPFRADRAPSRPTHQVGRSC